MRKKIRAILKIAKMKLKVARGISHQKSKHKRIAKKVIKAINT